eukprot:989000-Pleurochrysis_carterae.AAC.1
MLNLVRRRSHPPRPWPSDGSPARGFLLPTLGTCDKVATEAKYLPVDLRIWYAQPILGSDL